MRELMLKLLTYEPFEKISGDEKKFIDAVLAGENSLAKSYPLYYELMISFQKDIESAYWEEKYKVTDSEATATNSEVADSEAIKQRSELVEWFKNYYTLSKAGNIVVLSYKHTQKRAYYPILFKKICIYCILAVQLKYNSRDSLSNAKFFEEFGIGENILNKWHVSTRYLFLANRDTYSALRIDRNGVKKPYLTRIIKKVYYESGNQIKKYLDTAKKYELETFVDVFSATATVAASVDAKKIIVNDIDAGASCFLFAFIHYKGEVKKILADFHKAFVSTNMSGQELYTDDDVQWHYESYIANQKSLSKQLNIEQLYDKKYYDDHSYGLDEKEIELGISNITSQREFIKNTRNNYLAIEKTLDWWNQQYANIDIANLPTDIDFLKDKDLPVAKEVLDIIEYGAMWFFFWSIRKKNKGKEPFVTDMSESAYADYINNVLGFDFKDTENYRLYSKSRIDKMYDAKYFVNRMNLLPKNITFNCDKMHDFFKYTKGAKVYNYSYERMFELYGKEEGFFFYLDSPYFCTTDYAIPFQDREHKEMLKILRDASFHWLFSMQYYEGATKKVKSVARPSLKEYHPQIRDYDAYYKGFVNEFTENKSGYWVVEDELDSTKLDKLYVILFEDTSSNEIMICNFDVRPAIKYGEGAVVLPMRDFLKLEQQKGMKYATIYKEAVKWRQKEIKNNYDSRAGV